MYYLHNYIESNRLLSLAQDQKYGAPSENRTLWWCNSNSENQIKFLLVGYSKKNKKKKTKKKKQTIQARKMKIKFCTKSVFK